MQQLKKEIKMNLMRVCFFGFLMVVLLPSSVFAQEVCKSLLQYGTYDAFDSWSDRERFNFSYHAVCRSKITSYSKAKSASLELGIDIIDVISGALDVGVDEQNFSNMKSQYCSKSYSEASGSSTFMTSVRKASRVLSSSFVDCVTLFRKGFSAHVSQSRNKEAFAVHISYLTDGQSDFSINQVSAQPTEIECAQDEHLASHQNPIERIGSVTLNCRNLNPEKSFILAVNTNRGSLLGPNGSGVELPGVKETISDIKDRLDRLEPNIVQPNTIAFFLTNQCPVSWSPLSDDLYGRYIVAVREGESIGAVVGKRLDDKENRPVGAHIHKYKDTTFGSTKGRPPYKCCV